MMNYAISALTTRIPGVLRLAAAPAALVSGVYVGRAAGDGSVLQPAPWVTAAWALAGDAQSHAHQLVGIFHLLVQRVAG